MISSPALRLQNRNLSSTSLLPLPVEVVFDEGDGLPYQAHIQSLDNPQGTVLVYIEKLGVKRTVPARCVRPLPLNIYGEQLPVTQVNVLPYLKKNRRKKHPTIPVLFEDAPCSSFTSQSTSSSDSIDRHSGVHHSDVHHTAPSNRLDSSSSNLHSTHKSFQPIVVAPPQSSPVSTVVSPAALTPIPHSPGVYAYSGAVSAGPHAVLDERTLFCGASLDHSAGLPVTCIPQSADSGYCLVPSDPSQSYCIMSTGSAPQQGPVYWMPAMVAVPYGANVGQVNLGWTPTYNRDIAPAGLEYYQMTSQGQPEMTSGTMVMDNYSMPPPAPAVTLCSETGLVGGYSELPAVSDVHVTKDSSCSQTETGSSRRCYDNTAHKHIDRPDSYPGVKMNGVSEGQFNVCQKSGHVGDTCDEEECKGKDSEDGSEGMDVGSDGDSGCPSECADLSPVSGPDLFSSSELTHPDSVESVAEQTATEKPRGKRRYYMYGNHKLVKPIKEIPLRFQILLAETSAAKARCEGQPIYMQPLSSGQQDLVYYQTNDSSQTQLNANASCFIPNQDGGGLDSTTQTAYLPECFTGVSSSFSSPCTNPSNFTHTVQHTPMFLSPLPPSSASTSTQNCSTIIVYSSHSTSASSPPNPPPIRTITVPPPPFPPPSNMPPPPLEHPVCLTSSTNQNIRLIPSNQNPVKSEQQFKPPNFPAPPTKSLGMLSIPPPNVQNPCNTSPHSMTPSSIAPSQMASNSIAPSPMTSCNMAASSGIVSSYTNPTYISVQPSATVHPISGPVMQSQPPPYSSMGGPILQAPPSNYSPMVSSNQYMYIYPSPPTGQPASPHHLVYMVNPPAPTYQQQGVLVPLNCPVPVQ
ncbi:formin-like protein 3 [Biomphalaria pfeifferi]|uniref:Formin-like protein 3 n=1 Tax=Biomphalaria pfeifferi TaxID=112525 RepID=A0AAD8AUL0_BIOPF|nr:formin-like protein 3 [Biomphalaria pfeifferi]